MILAEFIAILDVCADNGTKILAHKDLHLVDLQKPNEKSSRVRNWVFPKRIAYVPQDLTFDIKDVAFGVEFRVLKTENIYISVEADVELINLKNQ